METIEKRAKDWCKRENGMSITCETNAYIHGSTEQRKIDIDKACKWFKSFLKEIGYDECDWGYDDTDEQLESLRKSMEE